MNILPFVHEGLGNSSYLIGFAGGRAALVDPDRSVGRYLQAAGGQGWQIEAVLETHLHADFVSGARELAQATGARIFLPEGAQSQLPHHGLQAGERLLLNGIALEAVASPGHTPEHLSYVLRSERDPPVLFSGGSLIVGGAARTDLISPDLTEELTRAQYHTVREAFASLPDETPLYPTHGGGSFCSTGASVDRVSTLGRERVQNPLLGFEDQAEFVRWFPTTFPAVPAYFARMRDVNRRGPALRAQIAPPAALSPEEFDAARRHAVVVDVRSKEEFAAGHVPGALSNAFRDAYAVWLGWLVPADAALLFVLGGTPLERVVDESLLVGYERLAGWLGGGIEAWEGAGKAVARSALIDAAAARRALLDGAAAVDVRERDEYDAGHIDGAIHLPLGELAQRAGELPADRPIVAYCGHGERAATAVSLLERAGLGPLLNLDGGIEAWQEAGLPAKRG